MTPRAFIGFVLIALAFCVLYGMPGIHTQTATIARLVLVLMLGFIGTQVLIGKRLPGFRRRPRH